MSVWVCMLACVWMWISVCVSPELLNYQCLLKPIVPTYLQCCFLNCYTWSIALSLGCHVIVMWLVCDREADSDCAHLIWRRPGGGASRRHHQVPGGWRMLLLSWQKVTWQQTTVTGYLYYLNITKYVSVIILCFESYTNSGHSYTSWSNL